MKKLKNISEIINDYADSFNDVIEKDVKYFEHKLYIQNSSHNNGKYVKKNVLGRDRKYSLIYTNQTKNDNNIEMIHRSQSGTNLNKKKSIKLYNKLYSEKKLN